MRVDKRQNRRNRRDKIAFWKFRSKSPFERSYRNIQNVWRRLKRLRNRAKINRLPRFVYVYRPRFQSSSLTGYVIKQSNFERFPRGLKNKMTKNENGRIQTEHNQTGDDRGVCGRT